jgi:cell division protein FtsB
VSEAKPRLVAVGDESTGGSASSSPHSPSPQSGDPESREHQEQRWIRIVLFALLAFTLAALLVQTFRARELHTQIGALESELVASQAAVAAHEAHLSEVRSEISDLQAGFERLSELVTRSPASR